MITFLWIFRKYSYNIYFEGRYTQSVFQKDRTSCIYTRLKPQQPKPISWLTGKIPFLFCRFFLKVVYNMTSKEGTPQGVFQEDRTSCIFTRLRPQQPKPIWCPASKIPFLFLFCFFALHLIRRLLRNNDHCFLP